MIKVHAGFGKQVLVLAEINWLAATTIQTSRVLQGFCFQSTSNSSGEEMSSGTLEKKFKKKKKKCLRWWDIHFTLAKPKRCRLQLDSVIIRALKQGYFLRFVMQDEPGSLAWWNEGEGWAEIREDGADGGRKVSTQVSQFYLNSSVQLHRTRSLCRPANTWEQTGVWRSMLAAGRENNMLM